MIIAVAANPVGNNFSRNNRSSTARTTVFPDREQVRPNSCARGESLLNCFRNRCKFCCREFASRLIQRPLVKLRERFRREVRRIGNRTPRQRAFPRFVVPRSAAALHKAAGEFLTGDDAAIRPDPTANRLPSPSTCGHVSNWLRENFFKVTAQIIQAQTARQFPPAAPVRGSRPK